MPEWKRAVDKSKKNNSEEKDYGNSSFENNYNFNQVDDDKFDEQENENFNNETIQNDENDESFDLNERKRLLNQFSDNNETIQNDESFDLNERKRLLNQFSDNNDDNYEYDNEYNSLNVRKIFIVIIIILILIGIGYLIYSKFFKTEPVETEPVQNTVQVNELIKTLDGFNVLGKIKIEKINVEQYILDSTSEEALDSGVGKIENGGQLNGYGNFAIAGHNYEGMFKDLNTLVIDDEITIINPNLKETTYVVKNISRVEPSDLTCLLQDQSKKQLTLITCEEGAQTRLVITAEEKTNNTSVTVTDDLTNSTDSNVVENTNG